MQVTICIRRAIIVDNNIDALNINTTTENIGRNKYPLFKRLESGITIDTGMWRQLKETFVSSGVAYRSSWARPEWIQILGKLQETSNLSNSMQRATDLTKMTT